MSLVAKLKFFIISRAAFIIKLLSIVKCSRYLRTNIGRNTYIDKSVRFIGLKNILIGDNSVIGEGTIFNVNNRRDSCLKSIIVGNNCFIGKRNFFNSAKKIKIGDYCLIALDCKFNGSNHIFENPFEPYVSTGMTSNASIVIGANCFFGTGVTVCGEVTIGYGCVLGAGSCICNDIPVLSLVVGNPAKVIKRYDVRLSRWVRIEEYDTENDKLLLSEDDYIMLLKNITPTIGKPLYAASSAFGNLL